MSDPRPQARTDRLVTEALDGELLVYDLDGDNAIHLNKTAALVWRSCDGSRTVAELSALVEQELGGPSDEDVVLMALDSLSEHGLLTSGFEERDGAEVALSRRRFFKRVGVVGAAAVNAPVVYSMIVPTAAAALSTGGGGGGAGSGSQFLNNPSQFNNPSSGSGSGSSGSGSGNSGSDNSGAGSSGAGSSGSGSSGSGSGSGSDSYP